MKHVGLLPGRLASILGTDTSAKTYSKKDIIANIELMQELILSLVHDIKTKKSIKDLVIHESNAKAINTLLSKLDLPKNISKVMTVISFHLNRIYTDIETIYEALDNIEDHYTDKTITVRIATILGIYDTNSTMAIFYKDLLTVLLLGGTQESVESDVVYKNLLKKAEEYKEVLSVYRLDKQLDMAMKIPEDLKVSDPAASTVLTPKENKIQLMPSGITLNPFNLFGILMNDIDLLIINYYQNEKDRIDVIIRQLELGDNLSDSALLARYQEESNRLKYKINKRLNGGD